MLEDKQQTQDELKCNDLIVFADGACTCKKNLLTTILIKIALLFDFFSNIKVCFVFTFSLSLIEYTVITWLWNLK